MIRSRLIALVSFALCIGCGGESGFSATNPSPQPTTPPAPPTPPGAQAGLRLVSKNGVQDTIYSRTDSVIFELRNSSLQPVAGEAVHVEVVSDPNRPRLLSVSDHQLSSATTDLTSGSDGRVVFSVWRSFTAGTAYVRVTAGAFRDSVSLVILPGNPKRITLLPLDTAVLVGGSVNLRTIGVDQGGNGTAVASAVTLSRQDRLTRTATGSLQGVAIGPTIVTATLGTLSDSVTVSVVPDGVIAADSTPIGVGQASHIVTFRTNGEQAGYLPTAFGDNCAFFGLTWLRDRSGVLYSGSLVRSACFAYRLIISPLVGTPRRLRPDTLPLAGENSPQFSPDGNWIYFTGSEPSLQGTEIWKVRSDGTSATRIGAPAGVHDGDDHPSPSPDGKKLVFHAVRGSYSGLYVLDLGTGTSSDIGVSGILPSWSPNGDLIAYLVNAAYYVVKADGTGARRLATLASAASPSWSPDGAYLIASIPDPKASAPAYSRLGIIVVATGEVMPLGWTRNMYDAAWRP